MNKEIENFNFIKIKRNLINDKEISQIRFLLNQIYQNNICKWRPFMDEYNYYQYFLVRVVINNIFYLWFFYLHLKHSFVLYL